MGLSKIKRRRMVGIERNLYFNCGHFLNTVLASDLINRSDIKMVMPYSCITTTPKEYEKHFHTLTGKHLDGTISLHNRTRKNFYRLMKLFFKDCVSMMKLRHKDEELRLSAFGSVVLKDNYAGNAIDIRKHYPASKAGDVAYYSTANNCFHVRENGFMESDGPYNGTVIIKSETDKGVVYYRFAVKMDNWNNCTSIVLKSCSKYYSEEETETLFEKTILTDCYGDIAKNLGLVIGSSIYYPKNSFDFYIFSDGGWMFPLSGYSFKTVLMIKCGLFNNTKFVLLDYDAGKVELTDVSHRINDIQTAVLTYPMKVVLKTKS